MMLFYFFVCDDLSFIKNFKTFQKKIVSMPRMDEKKLHTWEFQLKDSSGSRGNMQCKLLQKRFTGKTTECSKHLRHIAIEKDILSELNRCIFQIPLKYIKLVIPKILFIRLGEEEKGRQKVTTRLLLWQVVSYR